MFVKKCEVGPIRMGGFGCRRSGIWHQHGSALTGLLAIQVAQNTTDPAPETI
jgi:hypothetical protein